MTTEPKHVFTLIADDIRQEMGGKTSLMGLYDNHIVVPQVPYILPKLCFYVKFKEITDIYSFSFAIVSPEGNTRTIIDKSEVKIPDGSQEGTFNVIASPFEVEAEGLYKVAITLTQGENTYEHTSMLAISDAKRLQAEYEAQLAEAQNA